MDALSDDEVNNIPKILIIGAPRSGTTLVNGIICNNDHTYPLLPECTYITQLMKHCHEFILYSDRARFEAYGAEENSLIKNYQTLINSLIRNALVDFEYEPGKCLVMKDPEMTLLSDEIPKYFGSSTKVVAVVRDPRNLLVSFRKVYKAKTTSLLKQFLKQRDTNSFSQLILTFFERKRLIKDVFNYYWRLHNSAIYMSGCVHVVRYENLLSKDEKEFKELEDYLGFNVARSGFGATKYEFDTKDFTHSSNYGKSITQPESDFKKTLSKRVVKKIKITFSGLNEIYQWWP